MPLKKYLKIFVTRYCCITELKPIFHNPGEWLCKMVIIHALEIHLFNVLNCFTYHGNCQNMPHEKTKRKT